MITIQTFAGQSCPRQIHKAAEAMAASQAMRRAAVGLIRSLRLQPTCRAFTRSIVAATLCLHLTVALTPAGVPIDQPDRLPIAYYKTAVGPSEVPQTSNETFTGPSREFKAVACLLDTETPPIPEPPLDSQLRPPSRCPPDEVTPTVILVSRTLTQRAKATVLLLRSQCIDAHVVLDTAVPLMADHSVRPWAHYVPDSDLQSAGIIGLVGRAGNAATAWDRAVLWACRRRGQHEHQWFIEDDVAWEPADALANLIKSYHISYADLVAREHVGPPSTSPDWPSWRKPRTGFDEGALLTSFNVVCRLSRRLLGAIAAHGRMHGRLAYLEITFASIARARGMSIQFFHPQQDGTLLRYRPFVESDELQALSRGMRECSAQGGRAAAIVHPVKAWPHAMFPRP